MSPQKNHYQILGIASNVSTAEIKHAYRQIVKSRHPDTQGLQADREKVVAATEEMMCINEAYSTLIDSTSRAEYDLKVGLAKKISSLRKNKFASLDGEQERERFLRCVFHPIRTDVGKLLAAYCHQLKELSADPYDDVLVEAFNSYVNSIEDALRRSSDALIQNRTPRMLEAAVHMMRQSVARAADGLEELRYYLCNYNHHHLTSAESLFRISADLMRQSLALTQGRS